MRLNAKKLYKMLVSGANALDNNKEAINNMNVFPVPDGDTGINMTLTMGAVRNLEPNKETVAEVSADAAALMLRSARGNSGAILSLFFRGLSKAWKECETIGVCELAAGIRRGCDQAYKAVMNPTEGTILTVMRKCAEAAEAAVAEGRYTDESFVEFFEFIAEVSDSTLKQTPDMLPVLKEVGVVDAGGCGFNTALGGMLAALKKNPVILMSSTETVQKADFSEFDTASITFPYCTECLVAKDEKFYGEDKATELNGLATEIGDSVVFIEDERVIKLHVHTDHPGRIMEKACEYGMLTTVKVENMRNQHSELVVSEAEKAKAAEPQVAEPTEDYGFVTVCMGRGISDTFRDLGASCVIHGGQTMNPSTQDIIDGVRQTPAKTVFVLPNNKNIYLVAVQAAKLVKDRQVVVLNTRSVPEGVSALLAFDPTADAESNTEAMMTAAGAVTSMSVTRAVRDTTIDGEEIRSGQMLGLKNGAIECVADSRDTCLEKLSMRMGEPEFITLFYGAEVSEEQAEAVGESLRAKYGEADITVINGGQPLYDFIISVEQ